MTRYRDRIDHDSTAPFAHQRPTPAAGDQSSSPLLHPPCVAAREAARILRQLQSRSNGSCRGFVCLPKVFAFKIEKTETCARQPRKKPAHIQRGGYLFLVFVVFLAEVSPHFSCPQQICSSSLIKFLPINIIRLSTWVCADKRSKSKQSPRTVQQRQNSCWTLCPWQRILQWL